MPVFIELARRRDFLKYIGVAAAGAAVPTAFFLGRSSTPPSTLETPKPHPNLQNPTATLEATRVTAVLPTSTTTPRRGPLPRVEVPELTPPALRTASAKATEVARPTPEPLTKTPTPEKKLDEAPLAFRPLWEKGVPIAQFIPADTVFADENQSYLFDYKRGLICYLNSDTEPKEHWSWKNSNLVNNQAEFQPGSYDPDFVFAKYLGTLQIINNRLTAPTYIEAIDKKNGHSHGVGSPQPPNGNHQFFFHEGVIERRLIPGGTIETSFELIEKSWSLKSLWKAPGQLLYADKQSNIAVFSTAPWDYARGIFTANLQTGQERKNVYSPLLGETPVSSRLFEGKTMYAVVGNRLLAIDLRTSGPLWGPGNPGAGQVEEISKHSNGPFLYVYRRISNSRQLSAIEKASGKVVWTKEAEDSTIIGDTPDLVLAVNSKQRKLFGFNVHTGEKLETEFAASQLDTLFGRYGHTVVIRRQNNIYGIDTTNGKRRFFYGGFAFYPAVSGRALVFGILGSNKLWVIDIETTQEKTYTMKGEVVGVVSPKSRFFLVQTGTPKATLTAIKV